MGGRGGRRARGGTGQRLMSGILSTRLFELPTPLLVLPGVSSAQVSWRPNIFGGQDCIGPEGRSSSTPNVFGGYDTTFPDGSRSSSHPNVFGDEDTTTPKGTIESRPNIFGGKDYRLANSGRIESRPNGDRRAPHPPGARRDRRGSTSRSGDRGTADRPDDHDRLPVLAPTPRRPEDRPELRSCGIAPTARCRASRMSPD